MGASSSRRKLPLSFERDLAIAVASGEVSRDIVFGFYLVQAGIKKAYFYNGVDTKDITEFEWDLIRRLDLFVTPGKYTFVVKDPMVVAKNVTSDDIGSILGFRCIGDFKKKGVRSIEVNELTTGTQVVAEVCINPESARAYYEDFARQATQYFGAPYKFAVRVSEYQVQDSD